MEMLKWQGRKIDIIVPHYLDADQYGNILSQHIAQIFGPGSRFRNALDTLLFGFSHMMFGDTN